MRKLTVIFVCCLLFIFGCLIFSSGKFSVSSEHNKTPKVTVRFASWGSESEVGILKPVLADFEKENPGIKVDFMHIPQNYFQKIHLLFASNMPPDVIFINNQYLPIYANAGVLEELDKYPDFNFGEFYDKAVSALGYKGKFYAVPRDISTLVIFYNKDLFDKYNVEYPKENWTYDEFLKTAADLTHLPEVFGISFDEEPLFYLPYLMSFGEDGIPVFNNTKTQKGLQKYADLRNKYHAAPYKTESASATSAQMFLQERLGMHLSGRWLVPKYREDAKFNWDITAFPRGSSGSITPADASGWAIAKNSRHKKEAVKLIKYLSSEKASREFTKSGLIVPARIDTAKSKYFLDGKPPYNAKIFLDAIETSVPTPVSVDYREKLDLLKRQTEPLFNVK